MTLVNKVQNIELTYDELTKNYIQDSQTRDVIVQVKDYILKLNQDANSSDDVKYCVQMLAAVNGSVMTYLIQQVKGMN